MNRIAWLLAIALGLSLGIRSGHAAERILALAPHVCEIFFAIGAGDRLVGGVDYCDFPEAAKRLPRVGNYAGINAEAALRLHPDLAVVMSRNAKGVAALEAAGIEVLTSNPRRLDEVFADILRLGRRSGHEEGALRLVRRLKARLAKVRAGRTPETLRVFYELWFDPLLTVGGKSFINELLREAGGENVFADVPMESPQVSIESVVRAAPEVIIVPLEERDIEARKAFWHQWLPGVRVLGVDPDLLHRPGPRLIDGLEALQRLLKDATR